MSMAPFHTRFPEIAKHETRAATVRGAPGLPDGEYGFIEFYCNDPDCDCRRVVINVICSTTGPKVWASINYGWESLEFYEQWMGNKESARGAQGATLDPFNQQSPYSHVFLKLFEEACLADPIYVARLKQHYELYKAKLPKKPLSFARPKTGLKRRK